MSRTDYTGLSGPEFLNAIANAEEVNGNPINAAEFRRRARDWQRDLDARAAAPVPVVRAQRTASQPDAPRFRT
jgi:hypothetical protein